MKLKSIIAYSILTLVTVLYFVPKTNLYYKLEHQMQAHGIIVHNEHIDDKKFWLEITDAELYIQKIQSLHVQTTKVMLFGVYNQVDLGNISLSPTLGEFVPKHIDAVKLCYALYNPFNITGLVQGDFGQAKINIDLYNGVFTANIEASMLMKSRFLTTLENFTRDKKGVYHYEYLF